MRKVLITIFMMLILGFGIFGYTHATKHSDEMVEETNLSMIID